MQCKSETLVQCRLCLSTARSLSSVEGVLWAFQVVTDEVKVHWTSQLNTSVCWECKAVLHKLQKFKRQAFHAKKILYNSQASSPQRCLSNLVVNTKTSYDIECVFDPNNEVEFNDFDDGQFESKIFDPKIEIDIGDEEITLLDVWADPVDFPKEEETSDRWEDRADTLENSEPKSETFHENKSLHLHRRSSTKSKHKNKSAMKANAGAEISKILKLKEGKSKKSKHEKEFKIKVETKPKKVDATGKCLTCGGARRKRKRSLESRPVKDEFGSDLAGSPLKCLACNLTFNDDEEVTEHNLKIHSEDALPCTCGTSEREESLLQKIKVPEKSESGTYDCDVCGAKLKSEEYFRLHYEPHVSDKRFECDVCGSVYKTRTQMFRHLVVHKPPMFLCDVCGKRLPKISTLKTHFLSHASLEDRPHKCNICARTFITRDKLTIHVRFHDKVKPFKCKLCPYEFYVNFELTRHMKTHHCIGDTEEKAKKEKLKRTVSLCRNKRMNRDETGAQKKNSGVKPLVKQNKGRGGGGDLRCNICGKSFSQKVCLDAHIVVHTGDRPFKCEECGQAFKFQSNVLTHARSVHRADKLHQCTICGAQFKLKGNLTAHTKIHSGEKPFACDLCDQKFIRSRNLRNHYKVHSK